ncbi:hypothetical protein IGI04_026692 [Brassica rapa subsp. trilocularis]|uniref:Uncharacterized protein n=1 Tax=Brassica rapa subsp. trilocularis TaxID=1813537 RepID=A0ABQ7KZH1_BRACM|nr:hypothetical protein IGI04_026692 [Brassica rapa subsp. trilocularis]
MIRGVSFGSESSLPLLVKPMPKPASVAFGRIFFNTSSSNSFEILLQNEAVLKACGASDASGFSKTECCTSAVKK